MTLRTLTIDHMIYKDMLDESKKSIFILSWPKDILYSGILRESVIKLSGNSGDLD